MVVTRWWAFYLAASFLRSFTPQKRNVQIHPESSRHCVLRASPSWKERQGLVARVSKPQHSDHAAQHNPDRSSCDADGHVVDIRRGACAAGSSPVVDGCSSGFDTAEAHHP
jgi:hypothetical protein